MLFRSVVRPVPPNGTVTVFRLMLLPVFASGALTVNEPDAEFCVNVSAVVPMVIVPVVVRTQDVDPLSVPDETNTAAPVSIKFGPLPVVLKSVARVRTQFVETEP